MPKPPRPRSDRPRPQSASRVLHWPIAQLPGLNPQDQAQLDACGIQTTYQLLQRTRTAAQRQALATQLQTRTQRVNKWVALADLAQLPAVGCDYCGLLLHAGVSSVAQLAEISLPRLHQQILKLQVAMMQRPDLCPGVDQVGEWIAEAQRFQRSRSPRQMLDRTPQ
ncbi:MAG: DUF4332 domain-containing protein [Elainella sp.]